MGRRGKINKREKQLLTTFSRDKSLGKHRKKKKPSSPVNCWLDADIAWEIIMDCVIQDLWFDLQYYGIKYESCRLLRARKQELVKDIFS